MEVVSIITSKKLVLIIPFLLFIQANASLFSPNSNFVYKVCLNETYNNNPIFDNSDSTNEILSDLSLHSSNNFYSSKVGIPAHNASYGQFYCTANVDAQACQNCVQDAINASGLYCLFYKGAVLFYEECTLRYANYSISATLDESVIVWSYDPTPFSYNQFNNTLYATLDGLITQAAYGANSTGYATGEMSLVGRKKKLYTLAQCTPDILGNSCHQCLRYALEKMPDKCCNSSTSWDPYVTSVMTFLPSCQLRYEVRSSSSNNGPPSSSTNNIFRSSSSPVAGKNAKWYIMIVVVVAAIVLH